MARGKLSLRCAFLLLAMLALCAFGAVAPAFADKSHKQPPVCIVLYLESQGPAGEPSAPLIDLRDRLRSNDRLEVLVFAPDSPTFILAARSANPPISLDTVNDAATRLSLAQAAGAQFAVMAAPTDIGSDTADLKVFEIAPISRSWIFAGKGPKDGARAVADQILKAAAEPPPPSLPASPAPSTAGSVSPPAPRTVVPEPQVNSTVEKPPVQASPPPTPPAAESGSTANQTPAPTAPPAPVKQAPTQSAAPVPPANAPQQGLPQEQAVIVNPPAVSPPPPTPTQPAPAPTPALSPPPATAPAPLPGTSISSLPTKPDRRHRQKSPPAQKPPAEEPLITQSPIIAPVEGPSLDAVSQSLIAKGDLAMQQSDLYGAIEFYEEAVNAAPREAGPRMKLIDAYVQAGLKDQALDEERRALMIDPNNSQILDMLKQQTADGSLPGADLAAQEAAVIREPDDEPSWIALGDAYWNSSQPDKALQAYQKAAKLAPQDVSAQAHLARLYAATSQYDKSLDALGKAGPAGYPYALRIIAARTDSLIADIQLAYETFSKGNSTREEFYASAKKSDSQAQQLSQFVAKITPPTTYQVSYLHRRLATNLLAQATAAWLSFIETNDSQFSQQATLLQSEATREMKTASIAERLQSSLSASSH